MPIQWIPTKPVVKASAKGFQAATVGSSVGDPQESLDQNPDQAV